MCLEPKTTASTYSCRALYYFLFNRPSIEFPFFTPPELNQQLYQWWHYNPRVTATTFSYRLNIFVRGGYPWEVFFQPNGYFSNRSPIEAARTFPVSSSCKTPFLENVISLPLLERWWSSLTFACCKVIGYPYLRFSFSV